MATTKTKTVAKSKATKPTEKTTEPNWGERLGQLTEKFVNDFLSVYDETESQKDADFFERVRFMRELLVAYTQRWDFQTSGNTQELAQQAARLRALSIVWDDDDLNQCLYDEMVSKHLQELLPT